MSAAFRIYNIFLYCILIHEMLYHNVYCCVIKSMDVVIFETILDKLSNYFFTILVKMNNLALL